MSRDVRPKPRARLKYDYEFSDRYPRNIAATLLRESLEAVEEATFMLTEDGEVMTTEDGEAFLVELVA